MDRLIALQQNAGFHHNLAQSEILDSKTDDNARIDALIKHFFDRRVAYQDDPALEAFRVMLLLPFIARASKDKHRALYAETYSENRRRVVSPGL